MAINKPVISFILTLHLIFSLLLINMTQNPSSSSSSSAILATSSTEKLEMPAAAVVLNIDLNYPAEEIVEDFETQNKQEISEKGVVIVDQENKAISTKALWGSEEGGISSSSASKRRRYTAEEKGKTKVVVDDHDHDDLLELRLGMGPAAPPPSDQKPQQKGLVIEASSSGFVDTEIEDEDDSTFFLLN